MGGRSLFCRGALLFLHFEFIFQEGERGAAALLDTLVAPAFAADGHVAVVTADFNLFALLDEIPGSVYTGVDDCFVSAVARGFNLIYSVGDFEKAARAFEKMALEVGAEAVAYNVYAEIIDNAGKLINLRFAQELSLVDQQPFHNTPAFAAKRTDEVIQVRIGINPRTFALDAYAGADHVAGFPGVYHGLEAFIGHPAFFEIIGRREQQGGLGRPHRTVTEI